MIFVCPSCESVLICSNKKFELLRGERGEIVCLVCSDVVRGAVMRRVY